MPLLSPVQRLCVGRGSGDVLWGKEENRYHLLESVNDLENMGLGYGLLPVSLG